MVYSITFSSYLNAYQKAKVGLSAVELSVVFTNGTTHPTMKAGRTTLFVAGHSGKRHSVFCDSKDGLIHGQISVTGFYEMSSPTNRFLDAGPFAVKFPVVVAIWFIGDALRDLKIVVTKLDKLVVVLFCSMVVR